MDFTHFNKDGRAEMVNVSGKEDTNRVAVAAAKVKMNKATLQMILENKMKKGDVLNVAQIAGVMGAKKTSELIPMCHNILINGVNIEYDINQALNEIKISATVHTVGKTGVEMEALTAVSTAALTIYDMCKAVDKEILITDICLIEKSGGKSGHFKRRGVDINES